MIIMMDNESTGPPATNIAVIAHGLWEHTTLTYLDCYNYASTRRAND